MPIVSSSEDDAPPPPLDSSNEYFTDTTDTEWLTVTLSRWPRLATMTSLASSSLFSANGTLVVNDPVVCVSVG